MKIYHIFKLQVLKLIKDPMIPLFLLFQPLVFSFLFGEMFKLSNKDNTLLFVSISIMSIWQICLYSGGVIVRHDLNLEKTFSSIYLTDINIYLFWLFRLITCGIYSIISIIVSLSVGSFFYETHVSLEQLLLLLLVILGIIITLLPIILLLVIWESGGVIIQSISYPIFMLSNVIVEVKMHFILDYFASIFPFYWTIKMLRDPGMNNLVILLFVSLSYILLSIYIYSKIIKSILNKGGITT